MHRIWRWLLIVRHTRNLFRPFLLWYLLALAWGCIHVSMELHGGFGLRKAGVVLALVVALILLTPLLRDQRWVLPAAAILGAVESYYVAIAHFVPDRNTLWVGPIPWLTDADVKSAGWSVAYKVLIDVGLVVGLALLWTGVRAVSARDGRRKGALFVVACAAIMLALGHSRYEVNDGLWGRLGMQWVLGIGLVPLAVMLVSSALYRTPTLHSAAGDEELVGFVDHWSQRV